MKRCANCNKRIWRKWMTYYEHRVLVVPGAGSTRPMYVVVQLHRKCWWKKRERIERGELNRG